RSRWKAARGWRRCSKAPATAPPASPPARAAAAISGRFEQGGGEKKEGRFTTKTRRHQEGKDRSDCAARAAQGKRDLTLARVCARNPCFLVSWCLGVESFFSPLPRLAATFPA